MKSWQEQCADIIEYLESFFPDVQYHITFRKVKEEWRFFVETVRQDGGMHSGTKLNLRWLEVSGEDIEKLPAQMLDKAKKRIIEWQQEGLDKVKKQAEELEKAKNELEKRLDANRGLDKLAEQINPTL